jgi:hypothetical protein
MYGTAAKALQSCIFYDQKMLLQKKLKIYLLFLSTCCSTVSDDIWGCRNCSQGSLYNEYASIQADQAYWQKMRFPSWLII